jgi:hypothetical protein
MATIPEGNPGWRGLPRKRLGIGLFEQFQPEIGTGGTAKEHENS